MKKIFLLLTAFLTISLAAFATDVYPTYVSTKNTDTLGLYQAPNEIILYAAPSDNAKVIYNIRWEGEKISPATLTPGDVFVVLVPEKNLGLMAVSDEIEDWVEVIYNNKTGAKGWMKNDDPYKFISWVNFIGMYGKKYGLNILGGVPDMVFNLYSAPDEFSQVVSRINHPQKINLTATRGNWALVSVYDLDKVPKTGYIRWRADNGVKYLFPAMK